MIKKNKLSLTLALLIGGVSAATAGFNGFYVGGHFGAAMLQGTHTYTNGGSKPGEQKAKGIGYLAGINAGYLKQMGASNMVLGGEAYFSMVGAKSSLNLQIPDGPLEGKANISHKSAMGGALIAGALLNPKVLMYAKMAYELDKFTFKYTGLTFQTPTSESYSKTTRAFVPGAGALYKMSESLLVGGEYGYAKIKKMQPRADAVALNGARRGYSFAPVEHRITAKVVYIF